MHGCNVCRWIESGQKPKTRMMTPAKCNCIPAEAKDPQFLQKTFSAMNNEKVKVTVDAEESIDKEIKELIEEKPKRRGRPPKVKHDN